MKYICTQEFLVNKYDSKGLQIGNKYIRVLKESIWEEVDCNILGEIYDVHLNRVWRTKRAKTHQWIEIEKTALLKYFKPIRTEVDLTMKKINEEE